MCGFLHYQCSCGTDEFLVWLPKGELPTRGMWSGQNLPKQLEAELPVWNTTFDIWPLYASAKVSICAIWHFPCNHPPEIDPENVGVTGCNGMSVWALQGWGRCAGVLCVRPAFGGAGDHRHQHAIQSSAPRGGRRWRPCRSVVHLSSRNSVIRRLQDPSTGTVKNNFI